MATCSVEEDIPMRITDVNLAILKFDKVMVYIYLCIVVIATLWIFGYHFHDKKPVFVKTIFAIFLLILVMELTIQGLIRHQNKLQQVTLLVSITRSELRMLSQVLSALAHWIFASKYFEVAINTKLYLT